MKRTALLVLSIISLTIGALGIAGVRFFASSTGLELFEIVLGVGSLIIGVRYAPVQRNKGGLKMTFGIQ